MSWLIITQDFPPFFSGGIASWAADLGAALAGAGEEVTVLARRTGDTQDADRSQPFEVVRMWGRSWNAWQGAWALLASWPRLGPEVRVVCATWPLATWIAPRLRGARLSVAFHGSDLSRLTEAPPALQQLIPHVDAFLPVSRFLAGRLADLCPAVDHGRVHVLPMPLPHPAPPEAPPRAELLVLSRLTPLKGIERAIALARALDRPLRIIGDGTHRAPLEAAAVGAPVTFAGRLDRADALAALPGAAALLLLPRTEPDGTGAEGLGLCLIEAALHRVPGIGCRTGGVPEATGPGLLLDDPDHPDLDAVEAFLADPAHRDRARRWACAHHGPEAALRTLRAALP